MQCWTSGRQREGKSTLVVWGCAQPCAVQSEHRTQPHTRMISTLRNAHMHSRNLQFQNCSEPETLFNWAFPAEVNCWMTANISQLQQYNFMALRQCKQKLNLACYFLCVQNELWSAVQTHIFIWCSWWQKWTNKRNKQNQSTKLPKNPQKKKNLTW